MAHFQKARMKKLELVAKIIKELNPDLHNEQQVEDLYDTVQWNTGSKRSTAEEYVKLVLKFAKLQNQSI